jgi:hypothetical protein
MKRVITPIDSRVTDFCKFIPSPVFVVFHILYAINIIGEKTFYCQATKNNAIQRVASLK